MLFLTFSPVRLAELLPHPRILTFIMYVLLFSSIMFFAEETVGDAPMPLTARFMKFGLPGNAPPPPVPPMQVFVETPLKQVVKSKFGIGMSCVAPLPSAMPMIVTELRCEPTDVP